MENSFTKYVLALYALVLASCATQVPPKGGPKDVTPPQILESVPLNKSLNYEGKSIFFEFDEYVRADKATQELLVTPPLKYPVEFKMKRKSLEVIWTDTLLEHTTYLFQFGEGIVDVNEGNALDSNVFVFSTGDYLDSFELEGRVVDALTLAPAKEVWVMLYREDIDSLPYKELPRYFAKSDESGHYHFRYLSPGIYKIFALNAVNSGYTYDQPEEAIAFSDTLIKVRNPADTNAQPLDDLMMFVEDDTLQYIKDHQQIGNKGLSFQFNLPVTELKLTELVGMDIDQWDPIWNSYNDSVVYWFNTTIDYDSMKLVVDVDDFSDTLFLRKPAGQSRMTRGSRGDSKALTLKKVGVKKIKHFESLKLQSETPISEVDLSSSLLIEENDSLPLDSFTTFSNRQITVDFKWKQGAKYRIFIPDSSIIDRFGLQNDTIDFSLSATEEADFGILMMDFKLPESGPYIWQLLKTDGKLVREDYVETTGSLKYENLPTGKYKVKIIYDDNGNRVWDTGKYLKGIQPEKVAFYDQAIEVRSNWVSEVEWNLLNQQDSSPAEEVK